MNSFETQPKEEQQPQKPEVSAERQKILDKFGPTGVEEYARLTNGLLDSERALQEADEDARHEAEQQKMIAERRLELFYAERDSAGAYKFKHFGREVQTFFEEGPDKPKVIEQRENGEFALAEGEEKRQLVFVNMGELDRFNKEGGGHAAGDAALRETTKVIEQIVRDHLQDKSGKELGYEVMRYSGNEFMISFSSIEPAGRDLIIEKINQAKPRIEGVEEGAPLVAHGFEMKEVIDVVNQIQLELSADEKVGPGEDAAREVVEVAKRLADHRLEIEKVTSRGNRIKEKLAGPGADPDKTKDFFDNYVKKTFSGTELEKFDKFQDMLKEDPSGKKLDSALEAIAVSQANKRFAEERRFDKYSQEVIRSRVKARRGVRGEAPPGTLPEQQPTLADPDQKLATIPDKTRGAAAIEAKKSEMEAAAAGPDKNAAEIQKLDYQIEVARRDAGTGLLDRGMHYEKLGEAMKEGRDVSIAFVDMGFLKYFDQMGGTEVGDGALKLAADIMEQAIERAGVEGKAFRYGGDEFTLQVEGGQAKVNEVIAEIMKLRDEVGRIPGGRKSKAEYAPTKLVFNTGSCDRATAESVFEDLVQAKLAAGELQPEQLKDAELVASMKADIMTTVADVSIETEKAVSRFWQLINERRDPAYAQDPQRKKQVDSLTGFSYKAIFKEKGGDILLNELAAAKDLSREEIDRRIRDFVDEQVEKSHDVRDEKRQMLDRLVDVHTKIRRLTDQLKEADRRGEAQEAEIADLKQRLETAERERKQLIEVRRMIDAPPADQAA